MKRLLNTLLITFVLAHSMSMASAIDNLSGNPLILPQATTANIVTLKLKAASKFSESGMSFNNIGKDTSNCHPELPLTLSSQLSNVIDSTFGAVTKNACEKLRGYQYMRFSKIQCAAAIECKKIIKNTSDDPEKVDDILKQVVAKEHVKNSLGANSAEMVYLEVLKRFAHDKYKLESALKCESRFKPTNPEMTCDSKVTVAEGLDEFIKKCNSGDTKNKCYLRESPHFAKNKYGEIINPQIIEDFFEDKVKESEISDSADTQALEMLGSLIITPAFENANEEGKISMFITTLGIDDTGHLKDPVLGFDLKSLKFQDLKNDPVYKKISELYTNSKNDFVKKFDELRKERALVILGEKGSCSSLPTLAKVCEETKKLLDGNKVSVKNTIMLEALSSRVGTGSKELFELKESMGVKLDPHDFETMINAKRCLSFEMEEGGGYLASRKFGMPIVNFDVDGKGQIISAGSLDARRGAGEVSKPENAGTFYPDASSAIGSGGTTGTVNTAYGPVTSISGSPVTSGSEGSNGINTSTSVNDKNLDSINKMTKKLADLEEQLKKAKTDLEKIQATSPISADNKDRKDKADEEKKLIDKLKDQISDLRVQVATSAAEAKVRNERAANVNRDDDTSSSDRSEMQFPNNYREIEAWATSRERGPDKGNVLAASAPVEKMNLTANVPSAGGKVILNVEGLPSERVEALILEQIQKNNDARTFSIIEGGIVKEIIPVIKAGVITFTKIVRGKLDNKKGSSIDKNLETLGPTEAAEKRPFTLQQLETIMGTVNRP